MKLREIPFGTPIDDPDGYCIYTNGHVDKTAFIEAESSFSHVVTTTDQVLSLPVHKTGST